MIDNTLNPFSLVDTVFMVQQNSHMSVPFCVAATEIDDFKILFFAILL